MNYSNFSKTQTELSEALKNPEPNETVITNAVTETEVTLELEIPKEVFGVVSDCAALNIREDCSLNAKVVAVVPSGTVLEIDSGNCDSEWLAVYTESGIEGFCMAQYVTIKD